MLTIIFGICLLIFICEIIGVGIRLAWGIVKILCTVIFFPVILIALFAAGLVYIALPILVIAGIVGIVKLLSSN